MTQLNPSTTPAESAGVENVGRGLLFSLGAIVVAIVGYGILAGVIGIYGYITGVVAVAIPLIGAWLYSKGAGAPVKAGRMQWIGIMVVAVILGALTVLVASGWYAFSRVGGDGGITSPAFWRTVVNSASNGDTIIPVIITLAAGAFGIYAALRNRTPKTAAQAPAASPFGTAAPAAAPPVAAPSPGTPVTPPPVTGTTTPPTPGVILNGEPVDPDKQ